MQFLPLAVLLLGSPVLLYSFLTFDDLVLRERAHHHAEWEDDRRPRTFLRRTREFEWSMRSWLATQRCSLTWCFITPSWIRNDPEAGRLHRRHRRLVACWCFLVVPAFGLASMLAVVLAEHR